MAANAVYGPGDATRAADRQNAVRATVATGAAVAFVLAGTAVPAAAETTGNCGTPSPPGTVTCVYDDPSVTNYMLRVPAGVTHMDIEALGAAGGNGGTVSCLLPGAGGGAGGVVSASFPVVAGDLLRILVGGRGRNASGMNSGAGGLNGGGRGGVGAAGGGGGGGSSSVRLGGTDPLSRILVAGGGGGGGGALTPSAVRLAGGGTGGGIRGADGSGDTLQHFGEGGIGAIGPSGGAGLKRVTGADGHSGYDATSGGDGGEGGYGTPNSIRHQGTFTGGPVAAGGGGGGWGGGGGGSSGATLGGGGGGGSGFVADAATAPTVADVGSARLSMGKNMGDGQVDITYRIPAHPRPRSGSQPAPNAGIAAAGGRRE